MERGCGIVRIDEAQFYFADVNLRAEASGLSLASTGLVSSVAGLASISTGTSTGNTSLSVELCDDPPVVQLDAWEEIVEVSMLTVTGAVGVVEVFGGWRRDLPVYIGPPQSWLALRVHARNRDVARRWTVPPYPVDSFLIQAWPAAKSATPILHKVSDQLGMALRTYRPAPPE